jgi:uncharacterized protein (TIGR03437 family)
MRALCIFLLTSCAAAQQYVISTVAGGIPPTTPSAATRASVGDPARVLADGAGNVYFTSLHSVFKVDNSGNLTRVAGNGRSGNSGDLGLATSAQLSYPMGMALDASGSLYVADRDANVVRRISGGSITTVASGLNQPFDVAIDSRGALYVADTGNHRVVRVGADGSLADVTPGGSLNRPEGIAFDSQDTLYIADTFNGRIRKVAVDGQFSTIAGTGSTGVFSGDGGPAVNAAVSLPTAIALDPQGNMYLADFGNARVRKISNGIITTVAGSATGAPVFEGEAAVNVRLAGPTGVAAGRSGAVYFAEGSIGSGSGLARGDYRVWQVAPTGELRTLAGTGSSSFAGDGGPASAAQLNSAAGAGFDTQGNLYIADTNNHRVRRIEPDGTITTIAGNGTAGFAVDFGSPTAALLNSPRGVVADSTGIFVADTANHRVRKIQPGGNIFTYAGNGNASYFGDGGRATAAGVNQPEGMALDAAGNLYIADVLDNAVRKVTTAGVITTIAGTGLTGFGGDGGPAVRALLNGPRAVAVDAAGNVYIADSGNNRIRRVDTNGAIQTIAGNGATDFFPEDSAGTTSSLSDPRGVAVDGAGNVYISDTGHNRVRKLFPGGAISTIAGFDGACCYAGDGGLAALARLNQPAGLTLDAAGNLYVADAGNSAIRLLRQVATSVSIAAVTNAASNLIGPISPGELITLYGTGMDTVKKVTINGIAAPLLYATTSQVGAVTPYGVSGSNAQITIETATAVSSPFQVSIATTAPGIFTADASGKGQALAVNQDGSRNGTGRGAGAGEVLTLYVTGEGQTNPAGVDGQIAVAPAPTPIGPITVTIGGAPAEVRYAGGAPGLVAGVMQVNVVVPDRVFGTLPVVVTAARVPSQPGVTVTVR